MEKTLQKVKSIKDVFTLWRDLTQRENTISVSCYERLPSLDN